MERPAFRVFLRRRVCFSAASFAATASSSSDDEAEAEAAMHDARAAVCWRRCPSSSTAEVVVEEEEEEAAKSSSGEEAKGAAAVPCDDDRTSGHDAEGAQAAAVAAAAAAAAHHIVISCEIGSPAVTKHATEQASQVGRIRPRAQQGTPRESCLTHGHSTRVRSHASRRLSARAPAPPPLAPGDGRAMLHRAEAAAACSLKQISSCHCRGHSSRQRTVRAAAAAAWQSRAAA